MTRRRVQILVVGSGFAGSLMAMIARRLGFSTALLERGRHPRFAIGESSTPLANLLLEEIACDYDLPAVRPLCKWGAWQKSTPQIACGLKRGFTFYRHELGRRFEPDPKRERQLLVGASPREEIADTHWYRPDFDHYLVQHAQELGVEYFDEVKLDQVDTSASGLLLKGERKSESIEFVADLLIDASGPRGFLHRALALPEKPLPFMPPTQALFSHFVDVAPLPDSFSTNGLIPPYRPEQAAVHHVFDGGWIWVLKFNNGITSAGVAATDELANEITLKSGEPAWRRLLSQLPSLEESFHSARNTIPFLFHPRIAFQSRCLTAPNWVLLPSAVGVVDPLLSTGFPLTLLGVVRLGRILKNDWQRPTFGEAMAEYDRITKLELESTARLVGALYETMDRFDSFKALALLYFAAASFSEAARRLGKTHLAEGFLLCENTAFSRLLESACQIAHTSDSSLGGRNLECLISEGLGPWDVVGLTDRSRHPWYPALSEDLICNAAKLCASPGQIAAMLRNCGF